MADVYEGFDPFLNRRVAIKVLKPSLAMDPDLVTRFLKEGVTNARINHPNVVMVFDAGEGFDGLPCIVMELLTGETLAKRIKRGPLSSGEAVSIASQVLAGLEAAHTIGVFHRDVKPSNIFLCQSQVAKLMDFGIAQASDETRMTKMGDFIGTPEYMSPEQIEGNRVGPAADVYALSVVLFEMLAGRPPFTGEAMAVLHQHLHKAPPVLTGVPPQLARVVQRGLRKNPAERYPTAATMRAALQGHEGPDRRPMNPWPVIVGAVALGAVVLASTKRPETPPVQDLSAAPPVSSSPKDRVEANTDAVKTKPIDAGIANDPPSKPYEDKPQKQSGSSQIPSGRLANISNVATVRLPDLWEYLEPRKESGDGPRSLGRLRRDGDEDIVMYIHRFDAHRKSTIDVDNLQSIANDMDSRKRRDLSYYSKVALRQSLFWEGTPQETPSILYIYQEESVYTHHKCTLMKHIFYHKEGSDYVPYIFTIVRPSKLYDTGRETGSYADEFRSLVSSWNWTND